MYQKRTMRRAMPLTRELMKRANEAEKHFKALKRLADEMYASDKAALALDMKLKSIARERGLTTDDVGRLTNDDFWPEAEESVTETVAPAAAAADIFRNPGERSGKG